MLRTTPSVCFKSIKTVLNAKPCCFGLKAFDRVGLFAEGRADDW